MTAPAPLEIRVRPDASVSVTVPGVGSIAAASVRDARFVAADLLRCSTDRITFVDHAGAPLTER